jgi:hypothetical protein
MGSERAKREEVCFELGCNVYGRLSYFVGLLESARPGRCEEARRELLSLLKFFPKIEPLCPVGSRREVNMSDQTLVNLIHRYISTDDTDESRRIIDAYEAATADQKEVVDDIFISLCGYQLSTLIEEWRQHSS